MKTSRTVRSSAIHALAAVALVSVVPVADAACYHTLFTPCLPAGHVLSQTPVQCRAGSLTATLYNQDVTGAAALICTAVDIAPPVQTGNVGTITNVSIVNVVPVNSYTVDPATCDITITYNVGLASITCTGGSMADPESGTCYLVGLPTSVMRPYSDGNIIAVSDAVSVIEPDPA